MKGFAHSKAGDCFNDFFSPWCLFLFGRHEIQAFFSLVYWKTDCSTRMSKKMPKWSLPCTPVYAFQELMEVLKMFCWRKKKKDKSECFRLGENRVAESSSNDMSLTKGSQQLKWQLPGAAEAVWRHMLVQRPHAPRGITSSSGLVHDFGEFLQNSVCSWQKNHYCFDSVDRQWECSLGRQAWLCESSQDWVWWYVKMWEMRILKERESYQGGENTPPPQTKRGTW